jgi:glycine/D-amino acid oxidase-like deaminating enzyme
MEQSNYWEVTAPARPSYRGFDLPDSVDCVVIGGGLTGLSAAYHLSQEGVQVAVLEQEHLGWGASSRNGGMGIPHLNASFQVLIVQYGIEAVQWMFAATLEANRLVEAIVGREGIDCDLQKTGSLAAAHRPGHFKWLEERQRRLSIDFDHVTRLIPSASLREEIGTDRYHGGLVDETSIGLHPAKFTIGMAHIADEAGVMLREGIAALEVRQGADGFEVVTAQGNVRAKEVIVATNGYTGDATPHLRRRVIPIASTIIATAPFDEALADRLIPNRRMVYDTRNNLYYYRILPDNRMLFGGSPTFRLADVGRNGERLRRGMVSLFPELAGVPIEYAWTGLVGMTFDQMPHLGQMDGLRYALGYNGDGLTMSVYFGMRLAGAIAGTGELPPFARLPFRSMVFYRKRPWFLPLASAYFWVRDRVG